LNVDIPAGPTLPGSREHAAGGWGGGAVKGEGQFGAKPKTETVTYYDSPTASNKVPWPKHFYDP